MIAAVVDFVVIRIEFAELFKDILIELAVVDRVRLTVNKIIFGLVKAASTVNEIKLKKISFHIEFSVLIY